MFIPVLICLSLDTSACPLLVYYLSIACLKLGH